MIETNQQDPVKPLPPGTQTVAIYDTVEAGTEPTDNLLSQFGDLAGVRDRTFDVSSHAADLLAERLHADIDRYSVPIKIVNRSQFRLQLKERDFAESELTNERGVRKLQEMLHVDSLIYVHGTATETAEQTLVDVVDPTSVVNSLLNRYSAVRTKKAIQVTRTVDIQTTCRMMNTSTGQEHHSRSDNKSETNRLAPFPFGGQSQAIAKLPPVRQVQQRLLRPQTDAFVAAVVGTEVDESVTVKASTNKACVRGVRLLNAQAWDSALAAFRAALGENPRDVDAQVGAGVACEKLKDYENASRYYEEALYHRASGDYSSAIARVRLAGADPAKSLD